MSNYEMTDPCNCDPRISLCDGDCTNNIWFVQGRCKLDQLTYEQVYFLLQRNPIAKRDLLKITSDSNLVDLANTTKLAADQIQDNKIPYNMVNNPARTLPYYTLFRGNINGSFK